MYNICRIHKKAQLIKILPETVFNKVDWVSPNSTTHKNERFVKGVWGVSLRQDTEADRLVQTDTFYKETKNFKFWFNVIYKKSPMI